MKTTLSLVGLPLIVLLAACGDAPPPVAASPASPAVPAAPEAAAAAPGAAPVGAATGATDAGAPTDAATKKYRVVVSFTSIGTGVDAKAKDQVSEIINKWRIARGFDLKTERPKWGREGESDICADLAELSDAERTKFIAEVRSAVGKNDRVTIAENATCHSSSR